MSSKKTKRIQSYVISALILFVIVGAFFSRLFYPELSLYITPEYNGSDTTNFNIPIKHFLSESLKNGEFPLWSPSMGTGFPVFAETQIGLFYLPNLLMFWLLPFTVAFNLGYVLSFFVAALGMYTFLRYKKFSQLTGIFGGVVFAFSGFFTGHLNHYNMLQAASLLPWLLLLFTIYREKRKLAWFLLFSLLLSQQFLAGYGQITFITLVTIGVDYLVGYLFPLKTASKRIIAVVKDTVILVLATGLSLLLGAVMLLPTREFMGAVTRPENFDVLTATAFSFPIAQFAGFLSPFILGSPKFGTFPDPEQYHGNFFWETVPYIGIIPLVIALFYVVKHIKNKKVLVYGMFVSIFVVLMLGKFSPAYFIYSIPPFNIFRVPSRFILPVIFGLVVLMSYGIEYIGTLIKKKHSSTAISKVIVVLLIVTIADLFLNWYSYHPIVSSDRWLSDPQFAQSIKEDQTQGRLMTLRAGYEKAEVYSESGWNNIEDYYVEARNEMTPNMNMVWDIPQLQAYSGLRHFKRHNLFEGVLEFSTSSNQATQPEYLLDIAHIGYVIAPNEDEMPYNDFILIDEVQIEEQGKAYYLYKNENVLPRARAYFKYDKARSLNGLVKKLLHADETIVNTAVVEEDLPFEPISEDEPIPQAAIEILNDSNQYISIKVDMPQQGLFTLADMYDPNWKLHVDGEEARMIPVNLMQRGVILSEGEHIVEFKYMPSAFILGAKISTAVHVIVLLILSRSLFQTVRARSPKK